MKNNILIFVEQHQGKVQEIAKELISEGKRLARELNVEVDGLLIGHHFRDNEIQSLRELGLSRMIIAEDKRLAHFTSVPYAKLTAETIRKYQPQIVLFGASSLGRDMAPRVASELKCGLTADCTELKIGNYQFKDKVYEKTLLQIRPAFGGNIVATIVSPESFPSMATVREGVMKIDLLPADETAKQVQVESLPVSSLLKDEDFMTEIVEIIHKEKTVDLKNAKVIVAVGMGAIGPQSLQYVKELATTIGAEIGASRPVIDTGRFHKDHQVGQTGITVRPNLYIACGISGQIQHCAGMTESKRIIAINSDPNAPIFKVAHYGIVGNVDEVLPQMIKAYKNKS